MIPFKDIDFENKKVFLRVDLNVPLENKKVTKKRVGKKLDKSSQDDVE